MSESRIDSAADKLQEKANTFASQGGLKAKLAKPLADDAEFMRKLKPRLMMARARGEAPTDESPSEGRLAPSGPQLSARPKPHGGGPSPFLVIGVAFAVGIAFAKVIDWRGHAHPRY